MILFYEIPMKWCSYEIMCTIVMNVYLSPTEINDFSYTRPALVLYLLKLSALPNSKDLSAFFAELLNRQQL